MRILILGGGAVGGFLAAVLDSAGAAVHLVARGEQGRTLAAQGLIVNWGRRHLAARPMVSASLAEAAAQGPFDALLMAVRGMDAPGAADEIAATLPGGRLVCLLNGVGHEAMLAQRLPAFAVCAAALTVGIQQTAPGRIRALAKGGLAVQHAAGGPCDNADLLAAFKAAGLPALGHAGGPRIKWSKLLLNMLGSATTAILGWPAARVFGDRRLLRLEILALREALAVMRALDLAPLTLPGYPVPALAAAARRLPLGLAGRLLAPRLAGGRGDRLPGPAQDLALGRSRTECEWLGGAVVRAGESLGIATPVNAVLSSLVADLAAGRADRVAFLDRPEALLAAVERSSSGIT